MPSLAIIGTGIAGMSAAWFLHRRHELTLYERNDYAGGHTHTVSVPEGTREVPVDTGFMVYNEATYPNLIRLLNELKVATKPTSMSFSVQDVAHGLEFAGTSKLGPDGRPGPISLNALFGQRRNLASPRFWRMLRDVLRFNKEARELLRDDAPTDLTLGNYLSLNNYSEAFRDSYLVPMSAAIWSTPHETMLGFPAATLVRFFHNHGLLGANSHLAWRTVVNGSRSYRDRITEPFRDRLRLSRAAVSVRREAGRVVVTDVSGESKTFDRAILACHADEALALLGENALPLERELLAPFRYEDNRVVLHSDPAEMPKRRRVWTSWNYRLTPRPGAKPHATTVYWMNHLQGVSDQRDYFVSVNPLTPPRPELVHRNLNYTHPTFNLETHRAQPRLPELNSEGPIFFCGSYFRYGFHEDALLSSVNLATRLLGGDAWEAKDKL